MWNPNCKICVCNKILKLLRITSQSKIFSHSLHTFFGQHYKPETKYLCTYTIGKTENFNI
jgi:hypothetical protein